MAAGWSIFFVNMIYAFGAGKKAPANYWGEGATTLEWTLSSPPPFHQFETLPVIEEHHSHHNAIGDASTRRRALMAGPAFTRRARLPLKRDWL